MNGKNIDMYLIAGQSNAAGYSYHNGKFGEVFDGIWYAGETDRSLDGKTLRSSNLSSFENFCFAVKAGLGTFDNRMGPEYGMAKVFTENGVYGKHNPCIIFKSAAGGLLFKIRSAAKAQITETGIPVHCGKRVLRPTTADRRAFSTIISSTISKKSTANSSKTAISPR